MKGSIAVNLLMVFSEQHTYELPSRDYKQRSYMTLNLSKVTSTLRSIADYLPESK